jgi:hypothetical protein
VCQTETCQRQKNIAEEENAAYYPIMARKHNAAPQGTGTQTILAESYAGSAPGR